MGYQSYMKPQERITVTPDSQHKGIIALLPPAAQPFALLARFDRPIGWWLLYWPGAWALLLEGGARKHWPLLLWMLLGAVVMRGAGCVYNDILDRDLDAQVARTRNRPLVSGAVRLKAAWVWLLLLCGIGFIVWLQLPYFARLVALASLAPVAAYPLMKRITWWPQAWLGIVFSWAALVGGAAVRGGLSLTTLLLYAGSLCWVIGYDTIYACQDREDDALIGVRSSALRMGTHVRLGVGIVYAGAMLLWGMAFWSATHHAVKWLALIPVALHLAWQVRTLKPDDAGNTLAKFRANHTAGMLLALGCWLARV